MLIIFFGLPGAGKTTMARMFSKKIGAVLISSDKIRKKFFEKTGYTRREREKVYEKMQEKAFFNLIRDRSVVLDATFQDEKLREYVFELADVFKTKPLFFYCIAPKKTVLKRLEKRSRKNSLSDADIKVYKKLEKQFNTNNLEFVELDCSKPKKIVLDIALKSFFKRHKNE